MEAKEIRVVPRPDTTVSISSKWFDTELGDEKIHRMESDVEVWTDVIEDHYHINNGGVGIKIFKNKHGHPIVRFSLSNMGQTSTIQFHPHPVVLKQISELFYKASQYDYETPQFGLFAARFRERGPLQKDEYKQGIRKVEKKTLLDMTEEERHEEIRKGWAEQQTEEEAKLAEFGITVPCDDPQKP